MAKTTPLLEIMEATKAFGDNEVLRGVSLAVAQREVVCILGPSGSGKSTLLRSINGLETIDGGKILLNGARIDKVEHRGRLFFPSERELMAIRKEMGMVFQQFHLFSHMSALDNITLGLRLVDSVDRDAANVRGKELLEQMGLPEKAAALPAQLSGGQQQRIAIARALAMRPQLILFDEPTSALDPELVDEVLQAMRALARDGQTMIIVTHEIGFAREVADRIVVMDGGRIIEEGPAKEVLDHPKHERTRRFLSRVSAA